MTLRFALIWLLATILLGNQKGVDAFLEPAIVKSTYTFVSGSTAEVYLPFQRSAYADTQIQISVDCDHITSNFEYQVEFTIRSSPCDKEFLTVLSTNASSNTFIMSYFKNPEIMYFSADYKKIHIGKRPTEYISQCTASKPVPAPFVEFTEVDVKTVSNDASAISRRRRTPQDNDASKANNTFSLNSEKFHPIIKVPVNSIYLLIVKVKPTKPVPLNEPPVNITVRVEWKSPYGYLSAIDWPLLPFYGVMCGVYAIYGLVWLILSACQWRDLLRVQYWIGKRRFCYY